MKFIQKSRPSKCVTNFVNLLFKLYHLIYIYKQRQKRGVRWNYCLFLNFTMFGCSCVSYLLFLWESIFHSSTLRPFDFLLTIDWVVLISTLEPDPPLLHRPSHVSSVILRSGKHGIFEFSDLYWSSISNSVFVSVFVFLTYCKKFSLYKSESPGGGGLTYLREVWVSLTERPLRDLNPDGLCRLLSPLQVNTIGVSSIATVFLVLDPDLRLIPLSGSLPQSRDLHCSSSNNQSIHWIDLSYQISIFQYVNTPSPFSSSVRCASYPVVLTVNSFVPIPFHGLHSS